MACDKTFTRCVGYQLVRVLRSVSRLYHNVPLYLRNKSQQDALFHSQFISIINIYIFQAGLLFIIRRHFSVYTAFGMCHAENNGPV